LPNLTKEVKSGNFIAVGLPGSAERIIQVDAMWILYEKLIKFGYSVASIPWPHYQSNNSRFSDFDWQEWVLSAPKNDDLIIRAHVTKMNAAMTSDPIAVAERNKKVALNRWVAVRSGKLG
jgi:hypothetical protein